MRVERPGADRAIVTLDEPRRLNALSPALMGQLRRALDDLSDDPDVRTIVLTGADPGFSAGSDLEGMETAVSRLAEDPGTTDVWRWIRLR